MVERAFIVKDSQSDSQSVKVCIDKVSDCGLLQEIDVDDVAFVAER